MQERRRGGLTNPYSEALGLPVRGDKLKKDRPSPSHVRAKKQEKEAANRLKGYCTPASGAGVVKGDARVKGLARVECKTTKHRSFSITLPMIYKIEQAALEGSEVPVMVIEFNEKGKKVMDVAVLPMWALESLIADASRNRK